jgi:PTH1 family peptidyl-tRNA hydrolase
VTEKPIRFIVGLGNPGEKYEKTRHNLGRSLAELVSREKNCRWGKNRWFDWTENHPSCVRLNAFMNESGEAVKRLLGEFKSSSEEVLICCDDFDLPLGTIRIRTKGSAGSHNGLKSVIECLGTEEFPRLRLGIGPVPNGEDPSDFVLKPFSKKENEILKAMMERASDAIETILSENLENAMNRFNG